MTTKLRILCCLLPLVLAACDDGSPIDVSTVVTAAPASPAPVADPTIDVQPKNPPVHPPAIVGDWSQADVSNLAYDADGWSCFGSSHILSFLADGEFFDRQKIICVQTGQAKAVSSVLPGTWTVNGADIQITTAAGTAQHPYSLAQTRLQYGDTTTLVFDGVSYVAQQLPSYRIAGTTTVQSTATSDPNCQQVAESLIGSTVTIIDGKVEGVPVSVVYELRQMNGGYVIGARLVANVNGCSVGESLMWTVK